MEIHEICPSGELAILLKQFRDAGGVVHHVLMKIEEDVTVPRHETYDIHKAAAIFTIQRISAAHQYLNAASIKPEKAQGVQIKLSEFFAPHTIVVTFRNLDSFSHIPQRNIDLLRSLVESKQRVKVATDSYRRAFFCPPYNLQLSPQKGKTLFAEINQHLFGDVKAPLIIYRWSTDWADYFDAGNEWWGSYFWTIYHPQKDLMIGIAASATD